MKKLLVGLFIFGFLVMGASQANASTLTDALAKIKSLENEVLSLKTKLGATALRTVVPLTTITEKPNVITTVRPVIIPVTTTTEAKKPVCKLVVKPSTSFCPNGTIETVKDANSCISYKCTPNAPVTTPSITVLSPNGGDGLKMGETALIKWKADGNLSDFAIELVDAKTSKKWTIFSFFNGNLNDGYYWKIGQVWDGNNLINVLPGQYYINIWANSNKNISDMSDGLFTIYPSDLKNIPDLQIPNSEMFIPQNIKLGEQAIFKANVINSGNIPATAEFYNHFDLTTCASVVACDIITLPSDIIGKPTLSVEKIASEMSTSYNFNRVGTYNIRACADQPASLGTKIDQTGNITELDENNNCSSWSSFNVVDNLTPSITVLSPNGGEVFKQGQKNKISWKGGKGKVQIGLVKSTYSDSTKNSDSSNFLLGWIDDSNAQPDSSIYWDGISLHALNNLSNWTATTGEYKVVVGSASNLNNYCFGKSPAGQEECNYDISDDTFTITNKSIAVTKTNPDIKINTTRTLKVGTTGEDVKTLQIFLGLTPDGAFGKNTKTKVIEWQKANNLTPDGTFGNMSKVKAGL
jgi:hypothetical protein